MAMELAEAAAHHQLSSLMEFEWKSPDDLNRLTTDDIGDGQPPRIKCLVLPIRCLFTARLSLAKDRFGVRRVDLGPEEGPWVAEILELLLWDRSRKGNGNTIESSLFS